MTPVALPSKLKEAARKEIWLPSVHARHFYTMSTYPPPGPPPGGVGRRIEEAVELIEMELRHAVAYVNEAIVPQVRSESITAIRSIADSLRTLADRLDQKGPRI